MTRHLPPSLTIDLNCAYPRYRCSVSDGVGTANGGFWKGFRTFADMRQWLERHGYAHEVTP